MANTMHYHENTNQLVINALEHCRLYQLRIRLFYGDAKTGVAWAEEHDTIGRVGRSTGSQKIPLLIASKHSIGGGAIFDCCIVAIKCEGEFLYKHPNFSTGECSVTRGAGPHSGWLVLHNNAAHADFKTEKQALRYAAFMRGDRNSK